MIGWNPRRFALVSLVVLPLVWHSVAHATVYSWKGADGVLMFSNDPDDVPEDQQATARQFTAKPAPKPVDAAAAPDPPGANADAFDAYARGFDAGLEVAERQVAFAAEMARATVPQAPPAPIIIEQPPPPMVPAVAPYYAAPYYGPAGYAPYFFPYGYGVSVVTSRHFSPGFRGGRFAPSFTRGGFSRIGMGRMR